MALVDEAGVESGTLTTVLDTVASWPGIKLGKGSDKARANRFIEHVKGNLLFLFDKMPADLRAARFNGTTLANVRFVNADLSDAEFNDVDLSSVSFDGVSLAGADLRRAIGVTTRT